MHLVLFLAVFALENLSSASLAADAGDPKRGEYIGRIYSESKKRPLYIVDHLYRAPVSTNPVAALHEKIERAQSA